MVPRLCASLLCVRNVVSGQPDSVLELGSSHLSTLDIRTSTCYCNIIVLDEAIINYSFILNQAF
jgi:hypothetical protein